MNLRLAVITLLLFATLDVSVAAPDIQVMERRAQESRARNSEYEKVAVTAFWTNDVTFMSECAPNDQPPAEPFVIYFEVLPGGDLGDIAIYPPSGPAQCLRRKVSNRKFPPPPGGAYVTKIDVRFKQ